MNLTETRSIAARDGQTFTVRRLRPGDDQAVQTFNWFCCHGYDDATIRKALARSEAGDDLLLGVFDGPRMIGYFFLWYFRQPVPLLGIVVISFMSRGTTK